VSTKLHISRISRRETHSSRAASSTLTAALLAALLAWLGTEAVLSAAGRPALLVPAADMLPWLAAVAVKTLPGVLIGAGAVLAVLGLLFLALGFRPGRTRQHVLPDNRAAIVVDDEVFAAAVSRATHQNARVVPGQVSTTVGWRRIDVAIRPTSGIPVDTESVRAAVREEIAGYGLSYVPTVTITIRSEGAVGA
jgi:hypothetical protein